DNRNLIAFIVIAGLLFYAYEYFVIAPQQKQAQAARAAAEAQHPAGAPVAAEPAAVVLSRAEALGQSPRIKIDTPTMYGSIALRGARIDDLYLKNYRQSIDPKSPPVELLRPEGMKSAYFTELGWVGANLPDLPT